MPTFWMRSTTNCSICPAGTLFDGHAWQPRFWASEQRYYCFHPVLKENVGVIAQSPARFRAMGERVFRSYFTVSNEARQGTTVGRVGRRTQFQGVGAFLRS